MSARSLRRLLACTLATAALAAPTISLAPAAEAAVVKPLDIVKVYVNPPGRDAMNNRGYTKEYIQLKNTGSKTLTLTGYTIRDNGPQRYTFPKGFKLKRGATVTIRSGKGKNTASTLYWGKASYIWNNTGDTARLITPKGKTVETCKFGPVVSKKC